MYELKVHSGTYPFSVMQNSNLLAVVKKPWFPNGISWENIPQTTGQSGQLFGAACAASSPNPPHARALTLNLILPDSLQHIPDCARSQQMPSLCPAPPVLTPTEWEEMRGIVLVICCYFCGDEHNQVVCPLLACALPMNSLADLNSTYVVHGDTQHKGLGEPV